MGWLMVRKHKDVIIKGKTVDLSDLEADAIVMFQRKWVYVFRDCRDDFAGKKDTQFLQ